MREKMLKIAQRLRNVAGDDLMTPTDVLDCIADQIEEELEAPKETTAKYEMVMCDCHQGMVCPQGRMGHAPRCQIWVRR